ncbi:hypothetical protein EYR41_009973 [Orbilia oligospora]|uniref:Uncharacterized protein n=1 Tax=Orbilia oligospora TaxID=2813651 RepID=A0A7C8KHZ9_ORBOL|nr:hypothetical protein TWF751_005479 [Orbilia oligospora]TGJ63883.1 hypothetical protein EYR41_009973 [Orbilia oligospora]
MFKSDFQITTIPEIVADEPSPGLPPQWDDYDMDPGAKSDHKPPILNLSIDILALVIEYLSFRDIISLSLTTKGFRHLRPEPASNPSSAPLSPPLSPGNEALCSARIHQRFLAHKSSQTSTEKCPYCAHDLCPTSCSSALFLDTQTGIFFPASLYNKNKALFKYSAEFTKRETALLTPNKRESLHLGHNKRESFMGHSKRESLLISPKRQSTMMHMAINTPKPVEFVYSTIWCEHHRCPRDLLAQKNTFNNAGEDIANGAGKFLLEYNNELRWERARRDRGPRYSLWTRWLVGYKSDTQAQIQRTASVAGSAPRRKSIIPWLDSQPVPSGGSTRRKSLIPWLDRDREPSLTPPPPPGVGSGGSGGRRKSLFSWLDKFKDPSELEGAKQPDPVYERSFYETYCLHCLRPLRMQGASRGLHSHWQGLSCECRTASHAIGGGCRRCGVASVRFTLIETFDKIWEKKMDKAEGAIKNQSYWLFVATECEIIRAAGPGALVETKRLRPRNPIAAAKALDTVRGYEIVPLPNFSPVGLQDLPYEVLRRIVDYLRDMETFQRDPHFWAMQATYCFPKAWQGSFGDFNAMNVHEDPCLS